MNKYLEIKLRAYIGIFLKLFFIGSVLNGFFIFKFFSNKYLCFLGIEVISGIFIFCLFITVNRYLKKRSILFTHMSKRVQELEIILKNIPSGVIGVDRAGGITFVNKKAEQILELPEAQSLGKWPGDVIVFKDKKGETILKQLKRIRTIKEPYLFYNTHLESPSGKNYKVSGYVCPTSFNVVTSALLVINEEIKDKEPSKLELIKKRIEILQNVLSNIPVGVLVRDLKTSEVIYVSNTFKEIHDIKSTIPLNRVTLQQYLSHSLEYRQYLIDTLKDSTIKQNLATWTDVNILSASGERRIIGLNSKLCKESNLAITTIINKNDDIYHKQYYKNLKRDFDHLINASNDGFVIINSVGKIVCWSKGLIKLSGLTDTEVSGKSIWDVETLIDVSNAQRSIDERRNEFVKIINTGNLSKKDSILHTVTSRIKNQKTGKISIVNVYSYVCYQDDSCRMYIIYRKINKIVYQRKIISDYKRFVSSCISDLIPILYIYDIPAKHYVFVKSNYMDLKFEEIICQQPSLVCQLQVHPNDIEPLYRYIDELECTDSRKISSLVFRIKYYENEYRWFQRKDLVYKRSEDGKIEQILGCAAEITKIMQYSENNKYSLKPFDK